jgi:hypothetical protein
MVAELPEEALRAALTPMSKNAIVGEQALSPTTRLTARIQRTPLRGAADARR